MQSAEDIQLRVAHFYANGAAADMSTEAMEAELEKRKCQNVFPLDVFHPEAAAYMKIIHQHMDVPRAYLGLNMLAAYSSAIGTAYGIDRGGEMMYMSMWACMDGMTSSGKSLALKLVYGPLMRLQAELDQEYEKACMAEPLDGEKWQDNPRMPTVIYRDSHVPTLVRTVMPDNPKGVTKMADELLEWVNGFNAMSGNKEGTDEQFWLSGWNGASYSGIRSGRKKFTVPRVFVNVVGGVQPGIAWKLFRNDRDVTGFIFRLLFATAEENRIALPDGGFRLSDSERERHEKLIINLWKALPVNNPYDAPNVLVLTQQASLMHDKWKRAKAVAINQMDEENHREIHAGILGKIEDYALRFSGLLCVSDMAYENKTFAYRAEITPEHMARALRLADYFYQSAWDVYGRVNKTIYAPIEVLRWAGYVRGGMTLEKMGGMEFPKLKGKEAQRKKAGRELRKMIAEYPKIFGAVNKA